MRQTRKQRAEELLRRLQAGPAFCVPVEGTPYSAQRAKEAYKRWAESWVLDDLVALVPELKEKAL